ncbi:MAG: uroporphyrinogen-III synthase [Planctomycetota bacterium]
MRVWVTRDEPDDGPLSTALRAVELTVVNEPVLERRVVNDAAQVLAQLGPDDWLVLTSVYAIEAVATHFARTPRVAVVGEASRRAAAAKGFRVEHVSSGGDAASLFEELRRKATRGKVCYPRSSLAEPPKAWPGVELLAPVLYETCARAFDRRVIDRVDVVSVASPSAVEAIGVVARRYASIGPSTSAALRRIGVEPWVEASERTFEGLAGAIAAHGDLRFQI